MTAEVVVEALAQCMPIGSLVFIPANDVAPVMRKARKGIDNDLNAGNLALAPQTPRVPSARPPKPPSVPPSQTSLVAKLSEHVHSCMVILDLDLRDKKLTFDAQPLPVA